MDNSTETYSIVIPVYNGSPSLCELIERCIETTKSNQINLQKIILVDDASIDNSWEIIKDLKLKNNNLITGIRLRKNFGQHNATCAGLNVINSDWTITMDDDLECAPEDIVELINTAKKSNADVVYGKFQSSNRNIIKKLFKLPYEIIAKIAGGNSKVNGSSFRLIKSDLSKNISRRATNFVFIDEVIFWYTDNISFASIKHHPSKRKKSNYRLRDLFKLGGNVVMYSSLLPLKIVKLIGFVVSFGMFLLGTYFIIKHTFFGVSIKGFTATIVTITFSTGVIIFILGVIGEYLGKIFRNSNNSPVYSIDEEI